MPKAGDKYVAMIVGEANPYGGDPYYALYPSPDGCSGHRLCCMIFGMRRSHYLRYFLRRNLCPHRWSTREARAHAATLNGTMILCGTKVASAFRVPFEPFTIRHQNVLGSRRLLVLPHPSGLCRLWQEPGAIQKARESLVKLCPSLSKVVGLSDGSNDDSGEDGDDGLDPGRVPHGLGDED